MVHSRGFDDSLTALEDLDALVLDLECGCLHWRLPFPQGCLRFAEARMNRQNNHEQTAYFSRRLQNPRLTREEAFLENPAWKANSKVLDAFEMEGIMELSFSIPQVRALYESVVQKNIPVIAISTLPVSETLVQLLLQKNGFERVDVRLQAENDDALKKSLDDSCEELNISRPLLLSTRWNQNPTQFAGIPLSHRLSNPPDVLYKPLCDCLWDGFDESFFIQNPSISQHPDHLLGWYLLGPTLLAWFQNLRQFSDVHFLGHASATLTRLWERVGPFLVRITETTQPDAVVGLIPQHEDQISLFPSPQIPSDHFLDPQAIGLPHLHQGFWPIFAKLLSRAEDPLWNSATQFLHQFAQIMRGLPMSLNGDILVERWRNWLLQPSQEQAEYWVSRLNLTRGVSAIKQPIWPTGVWQLLSPTQRRLARLRFPKRCQRIESLQSPPY